MARRKAKVGRRVKKTPHIQRNKNKNYIRLLIRPYLGKPKAMGMTALE